MAYNVGVKKGREFPARPLSEDFMEKYFIVVPCYNEEEVLPETMKRLGEKLSSLVERGIASEASRVLFVDDGSADRTGDDKAGARGVSDRVHRPLSGPQPRPPRPR